MCVHASWWRRAPFLDTNTDRRAAEEHSTRDIAETTRWHNLELLAR